MDEDTAKTAINPRNGRARQEPRNVADMLRKSSCFCGGNTPVVPFGRSQSTTTRLHIASVSCQLVSGIKSLLIDSLQSQDARSILTDIEPMGIEASVRLDNGFLAGSDISVPSGDIPFSRS